MSLAETTPYARRLAYLTFVDEDDGVMVGRPDTGSYALLPREGAEAVKRLGDRQSPEEVAAWFEASTGASLDVADLVASLEELGFMASTEVESQPPKGVRGQRLGALAFSPWAWLLYAASWLAAATIMVARPDLRPSYTHIFFTTHLSLLPVAIATAQPPLMVLHEAYHALAGRRLGLPSQMRIGRRLYFVVAETRLNALYSVPRRQRYLPFLAGIVVDALVLSWLTIGAAFVRAAHGPSWLREYLLALGVTVVVRLVWQAFFFLQSDLYFVISAACGCSNLQAAARFRLHRAYQRLLRRPVPPFGDDWTSRDVAASRWYAPLLFVGVLAAGLNLVVFVIPATVHLGVILVHRLSHPYAAGAVELLDTSIFFTLAIGQLAVMAFLAIRDRRRSAPPVTDFE
jgi:hypothetical protein